jgi:hypothetical protein
LFIRNRSLVIPLKTIPPAASQKQSKTRGRHSVASIIGGTCAIDAKILAVARLSSLVTRFEKRSKNFLKLAVFGVQVATVLIDF